VYLFSGEMERGAKGVPMERNLRFFRVFTGVVIAMWATLFAGCSTFPSAELVSNQQISYTVLGIVNGGPFTTYASALQAAQKAYPEADAVIAVKADFDDLDSGMGHLYRSSGVIGYFAVQFKKETTEKPAKTGFIHKIFG
jgi:hypothetical protein